MNTTSTYDIGLTTKLRPSWMPHGLHPRLLSSHHTDGGCGFQVAYMMLRHFVPSADQKD